MQLAPTVSLKTRLAAGALPPKAWDGLKSDCGPQGLTLSLDSLEADGTSALDSALTPN